jgi:hypothetical protein
VWGKGETSVNERLKWLAIVFGIGVAARLAILALAMTLTQLNIDDLYGFSDGGSYLGVGKAIYGIGDGGAGLTDYDRRVFPGWPWAIGWVGYFVHSKEILVGLTIMAGAIVPCLFVLLSEDRKTGIVLLYGTPAWLLHTIYPMAEGFFLALVLLAFLAAANRWILVAGLLAGWAVVTKPFGIAALAGVLLVVASKSGTGAWGRSVFRFLGAAAVGPLLLIVFNVHLYGDPLAQLHTYAKGISELNVASDVAARLGFPEGHWGYPFYWLIMTPLRVPVPIWKLFYIYAHVVALVVLGVMAIAGVREASVLGRGMRVWLVLCALLIVSTGPYWAFQSFDRYFLWLLPAAAWVAAGQLRRLPLFAHVSLGLMSALAAGYGLVRHVA